MPSDLDEKVDGMHRTQRSVRSIPMRDLIYHSHCRPTLDGFSTATRSEYIRSSAIPGIPRVIRKPDYTPRYSGKDSN